MVSWAWELHRWRYGRNTGTWKQGCNWCSSHFYFKYKNCRLAEPGEFTKLAFQNGKINLLKAESIADLISSETEIQRQQAIKIMNGKSADQFNFLREKLLKILSSCWS